jgi:hypothetical protein
VRRGSSLQRRQRVRLSRLEQDEARLQGGETEPLDGAVRCGGNNATVITFCAKIRNRGVKKPVHPLRILLAICRSEEAEHWPRATLSKIVRLR